MLDADLVLREVEVLLDGHYTAWQQRPPASVRVYERPQQPQTPRQDAPALTNVNGAGRRVTGPEAQRVASSAAPSKPGGVTEVVTNVVLLLLLTVLSDKFTRRRPS